MRDSFCVIWDIESKLGLFMGLFVQYHFVELEHFVGIEEDHVIFTSGGCFDLVGIRGGVNAFESAVGDACFADIRKEHILTVHFAEELPADGVAVGVS